MQFSVLTLNLFIEIHIYTHTKYIIDYMVLDYKMYFANISGSIQ